MRKDSEHIMEELRSIRYNSPGRLGSIHFYSIKYKKQLQMLEKAKKVVIFGAGNYGRRLLDELRQYTDADVCWFCDNNMDLTGIYIDGVKVLRVEMAIKDNKDAVFAVTPKMHQMDIKDQLIRLGVPEDQILLLDMERRWA